MGTLLDIKEALPLQLVPAGNVTPERAKEFQVCGAGPDQPHCPADTKRPPAPPIAVQMPECLLKL